MAESDPFQPSVPKSDEIGRLSANVPLIAGWPCRWCKKLLFRIVPFGSETAGNIVACDNCDQHDGVTP